MLVHEEGSPGTLRGTVAKVEEGARPDRPTYLVALPGASCPRLPSLLLCPACGLPPLLRLVCGLLAASGFAALACTKGAQPAPTLCALRWWLRRPRGRLALL